MQAIVFTDLYFCPENHPLPDSGAGLGRGYRRHNHWLSRIPHPSFLEDLTARLGPMFDKDQDC
jgi:hypothetical protein